MILFSELCDVTDSVTVDSHIWSTLGLASGLKYHLTLPGHRENTIGNEILCAPVSSRNWRDLWYLKIALYDRPGLLADVTDLLQRSDIDIVSCRAETTEPFGIVNLELYIDSHRYAWNETARVGSTETGAGPTLPSIRGQIVAKFIEELVFIDHQPLFSLWRVLPLYMAMERIEMETAVRLGERRIPIPSDMVRRLQEDTALTYAHLRVGSGVAPKAALRADTEAGILRVMLMFPGTGHLSLRIGASNELGTLARLSQFMRKSNFNMIQLCTTNSPNGREAVIDVILHVRNHQNRFPGVDLGESVAKIIEEGAERITRCEVTWPGV